MNKNQAIILLFTFVAFFACDKQEAEGPDLLSTYVGSWDIKEVSGGFAGTGYQMAFHRIILNEDGSYAGLNDDNIEENGNFLIYQNNGLDWIKFENVSNPKDPFTYSEKRIQLQEDGTLSMNDPCCDLYTYIFERVD